MFYIMSIHDSNILTFQHMTHINMSTHDSNKPVNITQAYKHANTHT